MIHPVYLSILTLNVLAFESSLLSDLSANRPSIKNAKFESPNKTTTSVIDKLLIATQFDFVLNTYIYDLRRLIDTTVYMALLRMHKSNSSAIQRQETVCLAVSVCYESKRGNGLH